ncbi:MULTISPECIES: GapA-binding peptide SR1P [Aeribacillus]|nr:GapA-binding peptide SR1P [Aeribacillus composti]
MGTIVCQDCNSTIHFYDDEKVTVLYGKCNNCCTEKNRIKSNHQ